MSRSSRVYLGVVACVAAAAWVLVGAADSAAITPELPFSEYFEPDPEHWPWQDEWIACDHPGNRTTCPDDPVLSLPPCDVPFGELPMECSVKWGPYKLESWPDAANGGTVFSGQRSGRQPKWDPMWAAILHPFTPPTELSDLRLKVWQHDFAENLCDCDQEAQPHDYTCDCEGGDPPPNPSRPNFDVHGWLILTNPYRTEYYVLGVNSKASWSHVVWATKTDGWNVTSVERVAGWRKMEILVHPYQGTAGDVEFLVDDVVVAQGRRDPGTGRGIGVEWLQLGGDPALITESHLTNTMEEFWYDEVELYREPPTRDCVNFDTDDDDDVDQADFGFFQACYTGPDDIGGAFELPTCRCMDADWDYDVDGEDYEAFQGCASGPGIPASPDCYDWSLP